VGPGLAWVAPGAVPTDLVTIRRARAERSSARSLVMGVTELPSNHRDKSDCSS